MAECRRILGDEIAETAREKSLAVFQKGSDYADERGIIVADTKFEFGTVDGEMLLIDECLTPDSSRFWPKDQYVVGQSPPSFDKQFVRDYLGDAGLGQDAARAAPAGRSHRKDAAKYLEAFERLTGRALALERTRMLSSFDAVCPQVGQRTTVCVVTKMHIGTRQLR